MHVLSLITLSVCFYVLVIQVIPAKAAEPILNIIFFGGGGNLHGLCKHVLGGMMGVHMSVTW